jgi:glutaminyl-tRNA synthetase
VRLKGAYILQYQDHITDADGKVTEVHCTYYENSRSGSDTSGVKAKGTLHWVSIAHAIPAEVRLYERLFNDPKPTSHKEVVTTADGKEEEVAVDFKQFLNPDSLSVVQAYAEPSLQEAVVEQGFQFLRLGYFAVDADSSPDKLIFNRTATLRDSWSSRS